MLRPHNLSLEGLCRQVGFYFWMLNLDSGWASGVSSPENQCRDFVCACMRMCTKDGARPRPPSGWQKEGRRLLFNQQVKDYLRPGGGGGLPHEPASARMTAHPDPQGVYDPIKIKGYGPKPFRVCKDKMVRAGRYC